jgi:hypothetical protein
MPSRKKAKGKARKARANASNLILHNDNVCRHGCEPISKDDICYQFVKQYEVEMNKVYDSMKEYLIDVHKSAIDRLRANDQFSVVWDDEAIQKRLFPLFVSLGTNLQLKHGYQANIRACVVAIAAVCSQYNFDVNEATKSRKSRALIRDLGDGLEYDSVRFHARRVSCQCLKKMYSRVKLLPISVCETCNVEMKRNRLYLCGRCRYLTYCSVKCQRIDYTHHKSFCEANRYTPQ